MQFPKVVISPIYEIPNGNLSSYLTPDPSRNIVKSEKKKNQSKQQAIG